MRTLRHALRLGMPPVVALALLAAAPGTSSADVEQPMRVIGKGRLYIYVYADKFRFCATGEFEDPTAQNYHQWTLRIAGVRGTETYAPPPWTSASTTTVSHCHDMSIAGYPSGHVVADWGFVGAAGYVFVHSTGGAEWNPTTGQSPWIIDFTSS